MKQTHEPFSGVDWMAIIKLVKKHNEENYGREGGCVLVETLDKYFGISYFGKRKPVSSELSSTNSEKSYAAQIRDARQALEKAGGEPKEAAPVSPSNAEPTKALLVAVEQLLQQAKNLSPDDPKIERLLKITKERSQP